jgi:hypothetical protein
MVYQRGGTYEVVLTGDTYESTMQLVVDLYSNDSKVGRMTLVPYNVTSGSTFTYRFNIRPYDYLSNYVQGQHYQFYWLNDWYSTTEQINWNNPYPNGIKINLKYNYTYINGLTTYYENQSHNPTTTYVEPFNNFNHYSDIPNCATSTGFTPSDFTNTGQYFDYVGGQFQFDDRYILQNFDQEIGTVIGTGFTVNTIDVNRRLSPMSQFLMDYPSVPEMSETSRFLTEAPRIQYIQSDENYVLYYLNGQSGDRQVIEADYGIFQFYNKNNELIDSFQQQLNFSGTTYASPTGFTDTLRIFDLPCGPVDISNIYSGLTSSWDDVAYYTVQLGYSLPTNSTGRTVNGAVGPVSEVFYFYLYNNCLPENTRVVWLNSRGGFDYYTFQSYRQDTNKISRQTYDSRYYSPNIVSADRNVGRVTKTFATDISQEIVLESQYLNLPVANWLEELFNSPQVYIMGPDFISPLDRQDKVYKDLTPVQILSTDVDHITKKHKKLNKYRITFKTANTYFTNRGF